MRGKVTIVCGTRGTGKTTFLKSIIQKTKIPYFVYDFHGDWNAKPVDMDQFIEMCNKAKNCNFIFEDATSYCSQGGIKHTFRRAITRSRGQGVNIYLVFHSLRLIPLDIFEMADYLILFKTKDQTERITGRFMDFPHILTAYHEIRSNPDAYFKKIIRL